MINGPIDGNRMLDYGIVQIQDTFWVVPLKRGGERLSLVDAARRALQTGKNQGIYRDLAAAQAKADKLNGVQSSRPRGLLPFLSPGMFGFGER